MNILETIKTETMNHVNITKSNKIGVRLVYITPAIAENYLRFNCNNRKPSDRGVNLLTGQMKSGLFIENGESIVFDRNGELKDGQHRLIAITKSGKSYRIPVVTGVEPNSMATFDTGKNRSAGDVLSINGFKYGNQIASFIQVLSRYYFKSSRSSSGRVSGRSEVLTHQQVLDYCSDNYEWMFDLIQKVSVMNTKVNPKLLTSTQVALIVRMIGGENPSNEVYSFMKHILGLIREESSATSYIYTKLYNSKINKEPLNFYWVLGMIIKAWNYYTEGNPSVKYFKFSVDQELPKINKQ